MTSLAQQANVLQRQVVGQASGDRYLGRTRADRARVPKSSSAPLSHLALRDIAEAAYTQKPVVGQFSLVPGYSSKEASVYVDPVTNRAVVALRGSANKKDFATDVALAGGYLEYTPRYRSTEKGLDRIIDQLKRDGYGTTVTGHSLGGSLARAYSSRRRDVQAVGFNTGYGIANSRVRDNYSEYLNKYDAVSYLAPFAGSGKSHRYSYSNGRYALGAHRARPTRWYK